MPLLAMCIHDAAVCTGVMLYTHRAGQGPPYFQTFQGYNCVSEASWALAKSTILTGSEHGASYVSGCCLELWAGSDIAVEDNARMPVLGAQEGEEGRQQDSKQDSDSGNNTEPCGESKPPRLTSRTPALCSLPS